MIDAEQRTLNRILNRHPYSDTLTRPALNDSVRTVSSVCRNRSVSPTDSAEEPKSKLRMLRLEQQIQITIRSNSDGFDLCPRKFF